MTDTLINIIGLGVSIFLLIYALLGTIMAFILPYDDYDY